MLGIIYLIIATLCAAMFSIFFKIFQLKKIDAMQAILFNYLTAFTLGIVFSYKGGFPDNPVKSGWFIPCIFMGIVFVAGMVFLNKSTKKVGVAISTVCSRSSMIIPIIVSYHLIAGSQAPKWIPIILVIIGMALTIWSGEKSVSGDGGKASGMIMPIVVFLTFGLSNSMLKIIQDRVSLARADWPEEQLNRELSLVTAFIFLFAALFGLVSWIIALKHGKREFHLRNVVGGVGLGLANYFCTYLLVLAMKTIDSSLLFPIHNLGIVAIGAIVGWTVYKEKMRPHQIAGIIIAAAAICWLCV